MSAKHSVLVSLVIIGTSCGACAEDPRPVVTTKPTERPETPAPISVSEPERADYYVYFGSFDDSLSAFQYSLSLALDGTDARRGDNGRYWVVTGPMMQSAADEVAEKHGGRVLPATTLESMMKRR